MAHQVYTEEYLEHQNRIASLAKALAHPARIAIIELLYKNGGCYCGDIVAELPLSQSSVSQHLRALQEVGLIQATLEIPKVKYCVDKENWAQAKNFFCHFFENN
ncbi:MAG: ArsR family transcriptional regulator [Cytophagales bacterium]|nr:MAG: ArsR family transcriptional regulator [Cytophagales bacterium]